MLLFNDNDNDAKLLDICEDEDEDINNLFFIEKDENENEKFLNTIDEQEEFNRDLLYLRDSYIETLTSDQKIIFLEYLTSDYYNIIDEILYLKYVKIFDYGLLLNKPEELKQKYKNGYITKKQYNICLEYYNNIVNRLKAFSN
jgi:hypothetical protein